MISKISKKSLIHSSWIIVSLFCHSVYSESPSSCVEGAKINKISFAGLAHTRETVVGRELLHKKDNPYSLASWNSEKKRLQDLDLFAEVSLTCLADTQPGAPTGELELQYHFTELFQYIPAPSVKQTDQDGWMLGGALAALNLFGYDIRAELQARGTVDPWLRAKEFAFYANAPWAGSVPLSWKTELIQTDSWDALRGFHDRSLNGELDLEQMNGRNFGGILSGGFRRLRHIGQASDPVFWLSGSSWDWVPRVGAAFVWDSRDASLDTRSGVYSEVRLTQNGGILGGPADYFEMLWDLQGTLPAGPGIVRAGMLTRYRPGTIGLYDRLHQGGSNTLRGNNPDSSVWGNSEVITNLEWRQALLERRSIKLLGVQGFWALQWVAGFDGAWLWKGEKIPGPENYRSAIYGGVHLVLPAIDRVRIEMGGNPYEKSWAFTIGLFEKEATQRWRSR